MDESPADEWVVLRNCGYMHEAELIVAVLDAEGVDAFLPDAQMAGGTGLTGLIQGVRVLVRASDLEAANEALSTMHDEELPGDEMVDDFPE
ncbi:MAG TPA: DUF2007 domain-containing protein [Longimicrobium sp.]|nr:DUF2007 domain-containing protein [Longimicrobium sp.]